MLFSWLVKKSIYFVLSENSSAGLFSKFMWINTQHIIYKRKKEYLN